jgi:hypothetical protein
MSAAALASSLVEVIPTGGDECLKGVSDSSQVTCGGSNEGGFSGFAQAQGSAGQLHAQATAQYVGPGVPFVHTPLGGGALANAGYFDTFSLTDAPGQGSFLLQFFADGSLSLSTNDVEGSVSSNLTVLVGADGFPVWSTANPGPVASLVSVAIPYSGLSPLTMNFQLTVEAGCGSPGGGGEDPFGGCLGDVNFGNTVKVVGLGILDANGNVVPGAIISNSSGYNYPALNSFTSPVPEPASGLLLLGGAAVLIASSAFRARSLRFNKSS